MNTKRILLVLIRVIAFSFLVMITYAYFAEKKIIETSQPVPYRISQIHCGESRSGASVTITVRGEEHYVGIGKRACSNLYVGQNINLYYNKSFNYYFVEGHIKLVMVIIALLFFCFTFMFKYLEQLEKRLKSTAK